MAVNIVLGLVLVVFIIVIFVMYIATIYMLQLHIGLHMLWKQLHMLPFARQLLFRKVVQIVSDTYLIVK